MIICSAIQIFYFNILTLPSTQKNDSRMGGLHVMNNLPYCSEFCLCLYLITQAHLTEIGYSSTDLSETYFMRFYIFLY